MRLFLFAVIYKPTDINVTIILTHRRLYSDKIVTKQE